MGYTFRFFQAGGVDAVESEFGYGRTPSLCCPPAGGRGHDGRVPGFRRIAQDRLQDFRSLQGARAGGPDRSLQAAGPLCQSATAADREPRKISSSWSDGSMGTSEFWPKAQSMRFSIVTARSSAATGPSTERAPPDAQARS